MNDYAFYTWSRDSLGFVHVEFAQYARPFAAWQHDYRQLRKFWEEL
jgi:hypothetical protein